MQSHNHPSRRVHTNHNKDRGMTLPVVAIGAVGLTAAVLFGVHKVHEDNQRYTLDQALEHSKKTVHQEIKRGQVSPSDITTVKAPVGGLAYDVARAIVGQENDPREISDILSAQTNNKNEVYKGETFVLPKAAVPEAIVQKH